MTRSGPCSWKLADGRRIVRLVHLPTGIAVEDDAASPLPIIARRNALARQLADLVDAPPT